MHSDAPAPLKHRPSLQRLKTIIRVGKRAPPVPEPPAKAGHAQNGQALADVQESEAEAGPSHAANSHPAALTDPRLAQSANHETHVTAGDAEPESTSPREHALMPRKSLLRISSRFRSNSSPDERRPKDTAVPPLPQDAKHLASAADSSLSPAAKARREAALRAAGLVPALPAKTLSEMEAEQDRRIGVVDLPSKPTEDVSEAAELAKLWRKQSTVDRSRAPPSAAPTVPPIPSTPPPSEPVEPPAGAASSNSPRQPGRFQHTLAARTHKRADSAGTSGESPSPETHDHLPTRPAAAAAPADALACHPAREPSGDVSDSAASASDEHFFSLPNSPQPDAADSASSPLSAAFSEHSQSSAHSARPVLVASSSVESDATCSVGPTTPQLPHAPHGFSSHRGAPAGLAPIIIEASEDGNSMSESTLISGSLAHEHAPKKSAVPIPSSAPPTTLTHPRGPPPSRSKSNGRAFGFLAKRTATLPPSRDTALAPPPAGLRRGNTVDGRSAGAAGRAASRRPLKLPPPAECIATLSPTMHSAATIQVVMNSIEDDESRRLSELAYI